MIQGRDASGAKSRRGLHYSMVISCCSRQQVWLLHSQRATLDCVNNVGS